MDFLNVIVNFLSAAVIVYGGGMAAGGLMTFGEGKKQNNPGKQDEGINGAMVEELLSVSVCSLFLRLLPYFLQHKSRKEHGI